MLKLLLAAALVPSLFAAVGFEAAYATEPALRAAEYLVERQVGNGAFGSEHAPADGVAETLASVSAVGWFPDARGRALSYIESNGPERASKQGAYAARIIMGLVAAGVDPRSLGSFDYVALLDSFYEPSTGAYDSSTVYASGLAVLGVAAAGNPAPKKAIEYLVQQECAAGGFSHRNGCAGLPDLDTTAIVLNALIASGVSRQEPIVRRTLSFIRSAQNDDGGFGAEAYSLDRPTNANSTALVISALVAAGEDPNSWAKGGVNPVSALLKLQTPSGGFKYLATDQTAQDYATVQAIPGVALLAYPLEGVSPGGQTGPGLSNETPVEARPNSVSAMTSPTATPAIATINIDMIVRFDESDASHRYCVPFDGELITGLEALESTGLEVSTKQFGGSLGTAVCMINGVGNRISDCPSASGHWHYWHLSEGGWVESSVGASSYQIRADSVEGWTWEAGSSATPPSAEAINQPCESASSQVAFDQGDELPSGWNVASAASVAGAAVLLLTLGLRRIRR